MSAQLFTATSNLAYDNFPVTPYRPPDSQEFPTQEAARAWLKRLRCGGSISTWVAEARDFRVVEEIPPG